MTVGGSSLVKSRLLHLVMMKNTNRKIKTVGKKKVATLLVCFIGLKDS